MHAETWRCWYSEDSSDLAAGAAGAATSFTSPAPAGSLLAAHARPGPAGDLDIPERGGLAQLSHVARSGWRLPPHIHPTGVGRIAARGSRPALSQTAPRCAASGPSSLSLPSLTGSGSGSPQCHRTRCRLCRCAASGPSSFPSLTGPWGWVEHKCRDCWSLASGPLSPCPPPGPAGVIVTSTRIRTSGADVQ